MMYDIHAFDDRAFNEARKIMKHRFGDMVECFLEDAEGYIAKIHEGFSSDDREMIAQYAHPLKSSSASLGLKGVSILARDMEMGAKDAIESGGSVEHLSTLAPQIEQALQEGRVILGQKMHS